MNTIECYFHCLIVMIVFCITLTAQTMLYKFQSNGYVVHVITQQITYEYFNLIYYHWYYFITRQAKRHSLCTYIFTQNGDVFWQQSAV